MITVGLIGDYDHAVPAHRAIPLALRHRADPLPVQLDCEWVPTEEISDVARIADYDGLWCVPASPYRNMDGALLAIRHARESSVPFLGTCGGFQHVIVEYARHVLGWTEAEHAETAPSAQCAVISPLACALVETSGLVRLLPGSRLAGAYRASEATEDYRCRYGLNPAFRAALLAGPLRSAAEDENGEVRAVELDDHPFFVATLFQPERAVLSGKVAPLVAAFIDCLVAQTTSDRNRRR